MCAIWTNIVTVCTTVFAKDWMRQNVHCLNERLVPVPNKPYGFCGRKTTCLLIFYQRLEQGKRSHRLDQRLEWAKCRLFSF